MQLFLIKLHFCFSKRFDGFVDELSAWVTIMVWKLIVGVGLSTAQTINFQINMGICIRTLMRMVAWCGP